MIMINTDTSELIPTQSASQKLHYKDYSIIAWLSPRRNRRDFVSWVDQEFAITTLDTPENRVFYLNKKLGIDNGELNSHSSYIYEIEFALISVLANMESMGVAFDKNSLIDIWNRIRSDIARLESDIYDLIWETINLNSPKQLQVILFEKLWIKPTKKNKTWYSVDNDVLEDISKNYDIARLILEYRGLAKLSSTYVDWLLKAVDTDWRIHTTYDSLGAATWRMSSVDPNLQNIPTGEGYAKEIKACFIATRSIQNAKWKIQNNETSYLEYADEGIWSLESGNTLLVADYSQIELRILAFLSQDSALLDAFNNNEDIHARTAFFLFSDKVGWDIKTWKATSEQRRIAKSVNFGVIYGITWFWLAKTLNCSPWEAQEYVNAFYSKYPWVRIYYDRLLEDARNNWYVETYFGRRRYIPWVNDANKTLRSIAEREAMNMPVQWTAADIIKIAMIELDAKIRNMNLDWKMILQVHDELVFDIPNHEQNVFEEIVRETMEWVLKNSRVINSSQQGLWAWGLDISMPPIIVDISSGINWSLAK